MANKSNAVLNPAGIFVDGPRLYTTKTLEARNIPATYGNVHYVDKSVSLGRELRRLLLKL